MTLTDHFDAWFWQHPLEALVVVVFVLGGAFFALLKWLLT